MDNSIFMLSLTAPSGCGKSTITERIIYKYNFQYAVSHTTRQPRMDEIEGTHYYFISKEDFTNKIENNEFVEWAVYGMNFYGTSKKEVENQYLNKKND